jgi:hypothetical protein
MSRKNLKPINKIGKLTMHPPPLLRVTLKISAKAYVSSVSKPALSLHKPPRFGVLFIVGTANKLAIYNIKRSKE